MKKVILIFALAFLATFNSNSQSLKELNTYRTDSITQLPIKEVVSNFYIDWGANNSGGLDTNSQVIIININQYLMTSDTTKVIMQKEMRQRKINKGTIDFEKWYDHFEDFGILIYQELINDSIQE